MNNKSEPFTLELSKEFDRYMSIIDILDKKAHNLIIISSTFIAPEYNDWWPFSILLQSSEGR